MSSFSLRSCSENAQKRPHNQASERKNEALAQKKRFFWRKSFVSSTKTPTFATVKQKHALLAQLVEQLTLNQWVQGSNPWRCTKEVYLTRIDLFYFCSYLGIVLSPLASSNPHLHPTGTHIIQLSSHLQKRTSDKSGARSVKKKFWRHPNDPTRDSRHSLSISPHLKYCKKAAYSKKKREKIWQVKTLPYLCTRN